MAETVITAWGPVELGGGAVAEPFIHFDWDQCTGLDGSRVYRVLHRACPIGWVSWSRRWDGYAFAPITLTDFGAEALGVIADFCQRRTREHKAGRA